MRLQTAHLLTQFPVTVLHDFSGCRRSQCFPIRSRRDWEKEVKQSSQNQRFRFDDGSDNDEDFGFRNVSNKRIWLYDGDDDDDDEDAGAFDVDGGFDIREASIGINLIDLFSKIFRAFGWVIPAIAMSLLMGTEQHDSTLIALAVPLAQTAISFLYDAIWGRQSDSLWPKSKNRKKKKKRPLERSRNRGRVRREKEMFRESSESVGDYKSWIDSDKSSAEKGKKYFGGWDELEREPRTQDRVKTERRTEEETPLSSD